MVTTHVRAIFPTSGNKVICSLFLPSAPSSTNNIHAFIQGFHAAFHIFSPFRLGEVDVSTFVCMNWTILPLNQSFVWICPRYSPSTSSICPKLISDIEGGFGSDLVRFSRDPRSITLGIRGGINIMKTKDSGFSGKIWRRPRPARKLTRRAAW